MKKTILSIIISSLFYTGFAQLNIGSGANLLVSGNATVVLQDMNLVNNGTVATGNGKFKFTGSQNNTIAGVNVSSFYILEIAKTGNAKIQLSKDVSIGSSVSFISGLIDLGNNKAVLATDASLTGESETSRAMTTGTGFLEITKNLNAPNSSNPGNLGAIISSTANLGQVTIRRGHSTSAGTGLTTGINRYYDVIPANNSSLNAMLRFSYFDAENNGLSESSFVLYQSNNSGASWSRISNTVRNTASNYVEKTGLSRLSKFTVGASVTAARTAPATEASLTTLDNPIVQEEVMVQPKLIVGPNPNNGYFFFAIDGIEKPTVVALYTPDGKMIGNYKVSNGQRQQVSGLKNGMYILKAEGMEAYKVLVQGSSSNATLPAGSFNSKF